MSRTSKMAQLMRLAGLAARCERTGESAQEAIEREAAEREALRDAGRRRFAQGAIAAAVTAATGAVAVSPDAMARAARFRRALVARARGTSYGGIAVVGAGIAGLGCALELARNGLSARVYEASGRVGGRCSTLRGVFPGQVAERGAEFIGASHHTMLGYARAFGLELEDYATLPGSIYYHFDGRTWTEAQVVDEFRAFAASMRGELAVVGRPGGGVPGMIDETYDLMTVDESLTLHGAGSLLRKVVGAAYAAEYGAGADELSAMSFLRLACGDRRGKFAQVGASLADGFHVVDGNDRIASEIAARLPLPVQVGHRLIAVRKLAAGQVRLTFDIGGRSVDADHDAVVLALPFSVLRDVHLDASLDLPEWKRYAIDNAAMGDNAKLMVGFREPYWALRHGASGTGYGDSPRLQATWETNPGNGTETRAVLTSHIGGAAARALEPRDLQFEAGQFLAELDRALPGASAAAVRNARGEVLAAMSNWSRNPLSKGSYTCHRPGYFSTVAHRESTAIGNVLFAGEHTSSFFEWQGFMEGAALSGLRAANEALQLSRTSTVRALW